MNKVFLSTVAASMLISILHAGGDNAPIEPTVETPEIPKIEESGVVKTVDGYIRGGYQSDGEGATDLALGGKLHVETTEWNGISVGGSLYTTNAIGSSDGAGVPFFDAYNDSYTILGEAYLKGEWGNSMLKIGRQEIDTPFLDTDDIGMVPNTFEAALFVNKDLTNTTITLAHVEKMAGVDAEPDPAKFKDVRNNDYVQMAGVEYVITENIGLSGWYYNLKNPQVDNLIYADMTYTGDAGLFAYEFGLQYAHRDLSNPEHKDANIFGVMVDVGFESTGLNLGVAYNTSEDNFATNGFGGGPFYTSTEHLTLREANEDGDAFLLSASWDAAIAGVEGLTLGAGHLTLTDKNDVESTELDLVASYAFNDVLNIDVIYSDIEDDINDDRFENTRVFVNYLF